MKFLLNRSALYGALTVIVLFYIMLPYMEKRFWHAFIPEHQHWFISKELVKPNISPVQPQSAPDCDTCDDDAGTTSNAGQTVIHAFSPTFDGSFYTILVSLFGLFILTLPRTRACRISITPLLLKSAVLIPPEPPPTSI